MALSRTSDILQGIPFWGGRLSPSAASLQLSSIKTKGQFVRPVQLRSIKTKLQLSRPVVKGTRRIPIPRFRDKASADAWHRANPLAAPLRVATVPKIKIVKPEIYIKPRVIGDKIQERIAQIDLVEDPEELPWKDKETLGLKNPVALAVYGGGGLLVVGTGIWLLMRKKKKRK